MQFPAGDARAHLVDLRQAAIRQQFVVAEHQRVADLHYLAVHDLRRLCDADVVAQRFGHLVDAVQTFEQRYGGHDLLRLSVILLNLAPHQQVELLVGAAHFHVAPQGHGIVSLRQRIQQFVYGNRHAVFKTLRKLGALQDARHGVAPAKAHQLLVAHGLQPLAVEAHLGLFGIEDFEDLRAIGFGVAVDILARHGRARDVAARGIADERGHVADQENDGVA